MLSDTNFQRMSILLNTPKCGGMRNATRNWSSTDPLRWLRTGRISRESSRRPNIYFLTIEFKKLCQKTKDLGTS